MAAGAAGCSAGDSRGETPPGKQLQADFGETYSSIAGERVKVHLCVLTLGYSRRLVVRAYWHERQANWLLTMEEAFRHWRGVPAEVLFDNARALVKEHDPSRQVSVFNEQLDAFARYWGFLPKACRPYRLRPRGRTSAAAATSRRMQLPAGSTPAGRRWKRTWSSGAGR